jgi:Protein of unknown function (DUF1569)
MKSLASAEVLSETRERLLTLRPDDQPLWGQMTVLQMARHLGCAYEVALGDISVGPLKGAPPALVKFFALRTGLRWPKNLPTTPELKRIIDQPSEAELRALVSVAIERMESVTKGIRLASSHPMFGPMKSADWLRWGYLHADHHLRQFGR